MEVKTMFTTALKEHEEKHEQIGMKKGVKQERAQNAAMMFQMGVKMDIITAVTGLTAEEIEQLKLN